MVQSRLKIVWTEHNLKLMREGKKPVSMREIARATGLSTGTISGLTTNRAAMVHFDTIDTLCKYFDCEPGDMFLFTRDDEEQEPTTETADFLQE
jgi:putative transcriptional regulator